MKPAAGPTLPVFEESLILSHFHLAGPGAIAWFRQRLEQSTDSIGRLAGPGFNASDRWFWGR